MSDLDRDYYRMPAPEAVARLWASHGSEAVTSRYWFLNSSDRNRLNRLGRLNLGLSNRAWSRPRAATDLQECAGILAAYAIGAVYPVEVAGGFRSNAVRAAFLARGLTDRPKTSGELRGRATQDSKDAARGDQAAADRIAARRRHAEQVYAVCLAGVALVPEQPPSGRPRLPDPSPQLTAALAGFDHDAIAAVFPDLNPERTA